MLKVGIIGLGVGEAHIQGYQSHPNCKVVALCDFNDDKIKMAQEKYPKMKITKNADDILEDTEIDIVSIASYDNYHYKQILKAIQNNKHIFVEKPLCLFESEAFHMKEMMAQNPLIKMSSNLILRKAPIFIELKRMIDDKELGELFYIEGDYNYGRLHKITEGWRGKVDFYSVVYGGGVHMIDLFLWLTEDRVVEVSAFGNNIVSRDSQFRYNDMVVSLLRFESGIVGKIACNFGAVFPHFHSLTVYGTNATFINSLKNAYIYKSRDPLARPKEIKTKYLGVHKGDLIFNFIDSILNNTTPEVSIDEVFADMSICFAIEKSLNENRIVPVNYI